MKNVVIVDDHPLVGESLARNLRIQGMQIHFQVFYNAEDALAAISKEAPDLMITDLGLPGMCGIELIAEARKMKLNTKIMVFTLYQQAWRIRELMNLRVQSVLFKTAKTEELRSAFKTVIKGGTYFGSDVMEVMNTLISEGSTVSLTKREKQVMELLSRGKNVREICETLDLSPNTIDTYKKTLFSKLKVKSSGALIARSVELGLIEI